MKKPAVIMATSNGVGAGHLIRTSAIARELDFYARPILFSMANLALEVSDQLEIECEFVPGRDKDWMQRWRWDRYLRDRLIALIDETGAKVVTFDGVVPYPGILAAKFRRPETSLVWIRRGMWRTQPQGMALNLQSKLMDYIIEPGDLADAYDNGPTKNREDAVKTSPVTHYTRQNSVEKGRARRFLGLDSKRLTVLVQLGIGESDMNTRVKTVLLALSEIENVQVVMTREPRDKSNQSLAPKELDIKIIKHFPLVDLLPAFDAVICASGYNSVHEVLPAAIPTLFIPNIRGTDDQLARAKWCADMGLALIADEDNLNQISRKVRDLMSPKIRRTLEKNCRRVPEMHGAREIAEIIRVLLNENVTSLVLKRIRHKRILAQSAFERGIGGLIRRGLNLLLRLAAIAFRILFPHHPFGNKQNSSPILMSSGNQESKRTLKRGDRLESLIQTASTKYISERIEIARRAYRVPVEKIQLKKVKGTVESIALNSSSKSA